MQSLAIDSSNQSAHPSPFADTLDDTLDRGDLVCPRPAARFEAAGVTHPGLIRENNEDAYGIFGELGLCAVADGLGGRAGGEVASTMAVHEVRQAIVAALPRAPCTADPGATLAGALAGAVARANAAVYGAGLADRRFAGMATTFVGLMLSGDHVVIAHVGDSRAYRLRRGVAEQLTVDHSLRELYLQVYKERADPAVAERQANLVTRAVGGHPNVRVDVRVEPLASGDTFLLCSDGLWGLVSAEEMAFAVASTATLEGALAKLVATAYNRGGPDNITAVLVRPRESVASRVPFEA